MKIVKYLLIACGGLLVVGGGVVAYIAATFNPNSYKPQVIQMVKDKKQRDLKLDGDIKLKFWPSIGADLGKISLSEFKSDKEFAAVDSLRVSLKLMPLLSKKLVVDEIEVKGVRATIVKFKDGRMNIDDLLSKEEKKQEQFEFDIDHVAFENAALTYRDEAQGAQYALSNVNLKTGRIAPNVPGKIDLSMTVKGNKPKIDLGIALKTKLTFDLDQQVFSLQDMGFEAKGAAADLSNLNVKASGGVLAKLKSGELTTDKLAMAMTGVSGKDNLDIKFEAPKLQITKDKASGEKVTIAAKITNPQGVTMANVVLPGIEGTAAAFKSAGMTLDLDIKQGDQTIKAKVTSPLSGNFQTQEISLAQLGINITATGPNLPGKSISGNLNGSASVNGSKQQVQANLAGKVSDSTIKAQVGVNGFAPPGVTFDVEIDQLDLDRYAPQGQGAQASGGAGGKGGGADKPIDVSALRSLRANGKLRIGTLKVSNLKASNVRLEVKANGGRVDVSPLSANLYQGSMNGTVSVNAAVATPSFAIKQNLSGVAIGPLLKDLANKDMLDGQGTVNVDVTTQGATVNALKRGLNGGASVNLRDGAIKGIDVAGTIRNAKAKLGSLKGQQTQAADKNQKTDFSELTGTFAIRNGVASNNDLSMKSPLLRVGGAGDINIGEDSLNYLVKATLVGSLKGQDGREASDLKGFTVPVRATGPLTAPSFGLDYSAMLTDNVKQQAEEKIKGKLEGLLGGKKAATPAPAAAGSPAKGGEAPKSGSTKDTIKGLFGR
ncbi:MAG: AsmA family protein [Burkholderiales bacterium]